MLYEVPVESVYGVDGGFHGTLDADGAALDCHGMLDWDGDQTLLDDG